MNDENEEALDEGVILLHVLVDLVKDINELRAAKGLSQIEISWQDKIEGPSS